jgi:Na+-translocating ferredoxin:NAD+ oxidoreductase RnfC subunit
MLKDKILEHHMILELDTLLMREILSDIINGTLLLEADLETLDMVLTNIWEMQDSYIRAGVIIGNA